MSNPFAKLPDELIERLNAALVLRNAELTDQVRELAARCEELSQKVDELTRERDKNSSNSNKPPSSDKLGDRRSIRKCKKPTGRKRGGQKGHQGHRRQVLAPQHVDEVINVFPETCDVCQQVPPQRAEEKPYVHQVVDLLENGGRHVIEYRCHGVDCTCGATVAAPIGAVPSLSFGSRLSSTVCALTGNYHLSRRQVVVVLDEVFGISMSLGSVSNLERRMSDALKVVDNEAMQRAESAAVKHVDETSWIRDFERCSVWVFATMLVSVFRITSDGSRTTLRKIFKRNCGILVSDRAAVFLYWSMGRRQVCWSHLLRRFVEFSQRDGPAGPLGHELTDYAKLVFVYWQQFQAKNISKTTFVRLMEAVRDGIKPCLERVVRANIKDMSGSCANMLEHWDAMWTFVTTPGVEPTNNHAERELRRLVKTGSLCVTPSSARNFEVELAA